MHRFFLPPEVIGEKELIFPDEQASQIARVLRLKPGSKVVVLDNLGNERLVVLLEIERRRVVGEIVECRRSTSEPAVRVHLYAALTQREKFEWILQKCTEAGVYKIVPVLCARSLIRKAEEAGEKRARWLKIVQEAAEQSGRGRIPVLEPAVPLEQVILPPDIRKFILWEGTCRNSLREQLKTAQDEVETSRRGDVAVMVGPEGGFESEEVENAKKAGFEPVTLGPRILRMETAALAATLIVLYEHGDLG